MDEIVVILVQLAAAGVLLPVIDGQQPVVEGVDAHLARLAHIAGQAVEGDSVVFSCQLLVHIAEIQEHPHGEGHAGHGQGAEEHLRVQEIEFVRELPAQTGALVVRGIFVLGVPVEDHMLPEGRFLVAVESGIVQDGLQGALQELEDVRIGAVPGACGRLGMLEGALLPAEGFHTGLGLGLGRDFIFVGQAEHLGDAFVQPACVLPLLAETVVELGHGIEEVVPRGIEIAVYDLGAVLGLGLQHPVGLVQVQGALTERPQGQPRLLQQHACVRAHVDALQRGIIPAQPFIAGVLQAGGDRLHLRGDPGGGFVPLAQVRVQGAVRLEPAVEIGAADLGHRTLLQHGVELAQQGEEEQLGDFGAHLHEIAQGLQAGQGVGHEGGVLQGGVGQKVYLRAYLADARHVAVSDLIGASGALYLHPSLGNQVQCGHWLFTAADGLVFFDDDSWHSALPFLLYCITLTA